MHTLSQPLEAQRGFQELPSLGLKLGISSKLLISLASC